MGTALPPFRATTKDLTIKLCARAYEATGTRPVLKKVYTQANKHGRSPRLDLVMAENRPQSRIHDGIVTVSHKGKLTRFHVFVKNDRRLKKNNSIRRWKNVSWKGNIIVMKKGISHELVSLNSKDAHLADFAVKKFIETLRRKRRFSIPDSEDLTFTKP